MYVSYTLDIFCLCILKHRSQKYLGIDEKCFQLLICNICKIETVLKTAFPKQLLRLHYLQLQ